MTGAAASDEAAAKPANSRASTIFIHASLIGAILFQRFCVYLGGSPFYFAMPIFLAMAGWMLLTGRGTFRIGPSLLLVTFALVALFSTLLALNQPDPRVQGMSLGSLAVIMMLYTGLTVQPTTAFDGSRVLAIFVGYMRACSVLGILQYFVQFVGLKLFSFMLLVPQLRPILAEPLFNYQPIVAYGSSTMRSNGFFLVEPSTFSQLLVLTLLVEVLVRKEWRFVPLYAFAQFLTFAGTGLLALAVALPIAALVDFRRRARLFAFLGVIALVALVAALLLPGHAAAILDRSNELQYSGTSGYARYVAPLQMVQTVWGETRTLIGFGPGAMERADFYTPGSGSPAAKLFIDYGLAGLISFAGFIVMVLWRRDIATISVYSLVNFQLGGGFLLFPPFIVILAILCIWSDPNQPAAPAERPV